MSVWDKPKKVNDWAKQLVLTRGARKWGPLFHGAITRLPEADYAVLVGHKPCHSLDDDLRDILNVNEGATERVARIVQRLGQGKFRDRLLSLSAECCVTHCRRVELIRASHIKPWAESDNRERVDPYNGLLLMPNLDLAFDRGLISFAADGTLLVSQQLRGEDVALLGIQGGTRIKVHSRNQKYLRYHRRKHGYGS
jgi:predicted restriction endonuclease